MQAVTQSTNHIMTLAKYILMLVISVFLSGCATEEHRPVNNMTYPGSPANNNDFDPDMADTMREVS